MLTARTENFVRATRGTASMGNVPLCHYNARLFGALEVRERIKNVLNSSTQKELTPDIVERIAMDSTLNVTQSECCLKHLII